MANEDNAATYGVERRKELFKKLVAVAVTLDARRSVVLNEVRARLADIIDRQIKQLADSVNYDYLCFGCVRKLGVMGENNPYIVFFFSTVSTLVVTPVMIAGYVPMTALQWVYLLSAGVSAALAQFSITAAYTCAPAKEISVYDFSQIIFASLMSLIVFSQAPDLYSIIGYAIIIGMAVLNFILSNRKVHKNS